MRFEMKDCGGCRTCELACGYHHTGEFNPKKSSLRIVDRNDNEPGFFIDIELYGNENLLACDGCHGLEKPLCVEYCHQEEELFTMIGLVLVEKSKNTR